MTSFCSNCGVAVSERATACPSCGHPLTPPKSKAATLVLWFFLGGLGAHRFYLGNWVQGVLMLAGVVGTGAAFAFAGMSGGVGSGSGFALVLMACGLWILVDGIVLMFRGPSYYARRR